MRATELFEKTGNYHNTIMTIDNYDVEVTATMINEKCRQFLSMTTESLYRGINIGGEKLSFDSVVVIGIPRSDRQSIEADSSAQFMQNIVIEEMKKAHLDAHRGNSFFCSSEDHVATNYGEVYYVFPMDGFKFTWNPEVGDFHTDVLKNSLEFYADMAIEELTTREDGDINNYTADEVEELTYRYAAINYAENCQEDNLNEAIYSGVEIMILGKCIFVQENTGNELLRYLEH